MGKHVITLQVKVLFIVQGTKHFFVLFFLKYWSRQHTEWCHNSMTSVHFGLKICTVREQKWSFSLIQDIASQKIYVLLFIIKQRKSFRASVIRNGAPLAYNMFPQYWTCMPLMRICFRGLLLPKVVVDDHGGTRSDAGMLGSGIYFASAARWTDSTCNHGVNALERVKSSVCNRKEMEKFREWGEGCWGVVESNLLNCPFHWCYTRQIFDDSGKNLLFLL